MYADVCDHLQSYLKRYRDFLGVHLFFIECLVSVPLLQALFVPRYKEVTFVSALDDGRRVPAGSARDAGGPAQPASAHHFRRHPPHSQHEEVRSCQHCH